MGSGTYVGASFRITANEWEDVTITLLRRVKLPMRLQLYLLMGGSAGTIDTNWSSADTRMIEVMEIAQ